MKKRVVIVDGYSSGAILTTLLKEMGWECIHVSSSSGSPAYFLSTFNKDDYIADYAYEGDMQVLVDTVDKYKPTAVVSGAESGVIVADHLADMLGLLGNDVSISSARRDKYDMVNQVKKCGLRAPDHCLSKDFNELLAWANKGAWPIVVKPVSSFGTDSVTFCKTPDELKTSFQNLLGSTSRLGELNSAVLAQRLLVGQEYMVNGISGYGQSIITEIWRNDKIWVSGGGAVYDRIVLLDPEESDMHIIRDYAYQIIDALGIRFGASHTELMLTEQGPTLIECGARLPGGLCRPAANYGVGISAVDLLANMITQGKSYIDSLVAEGRRIKYPLWQVPFISNQSGIVVETCIDELSAALQSQVWIQSIRKPGDKVERTIDLFTHPGSLVMSHPDPDVLQQDYDTIREWEREGRLFKLKAC